MKKEVKAIRLNIYNDIILKAKTLTKLKLEETNIAQEWSWEIKLWTKLYKASMKTSPSELWEKIYFKLKETEKKVAKKQKEKPSAWKIFWYMAAALFTLLIIGWSFLAFILFNSNTVSDLNFFNSFWIDVASIKDFTGKLVNIIFSILFLIETVLLFIFIFKAILTKKEYKKQRITRVILSIFLLIVTVFTGSVWMILNQKISDLKWINYWKPILYDNWRYLSEMFWENGSIINKDDSIIWPISIRFNIKNVMDELKDSKFSVKKITWVFDDEEEEKPINDYENIRTFDEKWIHSVILRVEWTNIKWEEETRDINIADINITYLVNIEETIEKNWWKTFSIDASSLKDLWKINWFYIEKWTKLDLNKPAFTWYKFFSSKIVFDEVLIWIQIEWNEKNNNSIDQVFIIKWVEESNIKWEISYEANIRNDLEYNFKVSGAETEFWKGIIEEFKWIIDDTKIITNKADVTNIDWSSEITYEFKTYWEHNIKVELTDSAWNTKTLEKDIKIDKKLDFKKWLEIYSDSELLTNIEFNEESREYYIEDLKIPTKLKIDASNIRPEDYLYNLDKVEWDTNWDWIIDETWKVLEKDIPVSWNYVIWIKYTFKHLKKDEIITLEEKVNIRAEKKEALLSLDMIYNSDYTPVTVKFDASKSQVVWKDIVKFIYDYWDWIVEERDAKNEWHKYIEPGDYNVKLTVVTSDWSKYDLTKTLILKPQPQDAKIKLSMKNAPIYQEIDFSSEESVWQIVNYFWDFWDWETSIEANPSHAYTKPWKYKVKLVLDFRNKNTLSDEVEINIYQDF